MKKRTRYDRTAAAVTAIAAVALCIASLQPIQAQAVQAPKPDEVRFDQRLDSLVPLDLRFRDETGRRIQLQDLVDDKPVLLALVYYECPMLCTLVLNGMVDAMGEIPFTPGKEYTAITVSFNHEETHVLAAAKKASYLAELGRDGAEKGWHFLVGDEEPIAKLCHAVGFGFEYVPETGEFAHKSGIIILTPEGRVSRYFPGIEYDPTGLRLGLVEASENRIGSIVDRLFLLCYHYDPLTGQYGLLINRVVNTACAITLFLVLGSLAYFFRQERRLKEQTA